MSQLLEPTAVREPARLSSPPRAPLAFRVGIVGHRPDRLGKADPAALGGVVQAVLGVVKEEVQRTAANNPGLYAGGAPILRAISPLAEGTDRIFAEQALDLGFDLRCVLHPPYSA